VTVPASERLSREISQQFAKLPPSEQALVLRTLRAAMGLLTAGERRQLLRDLRREAPETMDTAWVEKVRRAPVLRARRGAA
jgi:hypothetical protein